MLILAKGQFSLVLKIIAWVTVFLFTSTSVSWSAPMEPPAPRLQTTDHRLETQIISLASQISIPPEIGSIREVYVPELQDQKVSSLQSPVSGLVVHIEDAHGQLDAQKNNDALLHHLKNQYGLNTLFLEGGFGKLDPALLHFFNDPALNQKLLDRLEEKGLVGGVERFLAVSGHAPRTTHHEQNFHHTPDAANHVARGPWSVALGSMPQAYGVEDSRLYRENLEQFRAVHAAKPETDKLLQAMRGKIVEQSAKVFHKELKDFFEAWVFQNESGSGALERLTGLQKYAGDILELNFGDAREQYDWPQLVRFFKLTKLEKSGHEPRTTNHENDSAHESRTPHDREVAQLTDWMKNNGRASDSNGFLKAVLESERGPWPVAHGTKNGEDFRRQVERFYESAAPQGFRFEDYPHLSRQIAIAILSSELQATDLLKEAEKLNDLLLEKLAKTDEQKKLIVEYREYCLLKKLFALELTRGEFEQFRATYHDPRTTNNEGQNVNQEKSWPVTRGPWPHNINLAITQALAFYETAEKRDKVMFDKMLAEMKESKQPNAILVTGGFHSEGFPELL